ncbi:tRNA (adenosine(37)-N6)-threonylcarbamoyltransferase complex transferase subunit TsaD [Myxococcota bacterium]|nr:tRNA (adenosine(37)-N6)-threonylcarbamoyltransferase complex transferase subunit TsaD [Myxococcota bacterium]MBU1379281.1 tRNA (adenosine(37)-N6)-threonylcarbamoyltransferase complex transferase subunit TsaD [Myxococcota bacterium]MBU1499017.1 tRNA (adenosine(37)-N6)-threonylcarbamoyltransferase complex transferase subunit TsaD [Myxococcota bacterium]
MRVLGIESSCDETAASVVLDGRIIESNVIYSQVKEHRKYGGVVPEIASRQHIKAIIPVLDEALENSGGIENIDVIAVTNGPGLVGSLLVGVSAAKALSLATGKPLVAVNHLEAHLKAPFCGFPDNPPPEPDFPHISLLVSGGHSILFHVTEEKRTVLGATRDDAAGEAFDKAAKMMGLGYPGGKIIDDLAQKGDPTRFRLPRGLKGRGEYDYSFSGLKTALMNLIDSMEDLDSGTINDLCYAFRESVVLSLLEKAEKAISTFPVKSLVVSGGVAANSYLRTKSQKLSEKYGIRCVLPPKILCTDNAAMVASYGYNLAVKKQWADPSLNAFASSQWTKRGELSGNSGR